jgi:hypothetical protein
MRAAGETVDFLPVMPIVGILLGGFVGMLFGTIVGIALSPPRKRQPPDLLRSLAMSWAKDGNYQEAIRCQTEALRFAPREWREEYRAELENYRKAATQN